MEQVYVAEVTERESEKGHPYWRVLLLQDGQRKVAYAWEPAVAKALVPGQEMLVELKQNGSKFPKVVKAEPAAGAPEAPAPAGAPLSPKDRSICKQVALKAAVETAALLGQPVSADSVLATAQAYYAWLVTVP